MRFGRHPPTAKYPYLATKNKQTQITAQVIGTALTHGEAFERPCYPRYPTGSSPWGSSLGGVVGEANPLAGFVENLTSRCSVTPSRLSS